MVGSVANSKLYTCICLDVGLTMPLRFIYACSFIHVRVTFLHFAAQVRLRQNGSRRVSLFWLPQTFPCGGPCPFRYLNQPKQKLPRKDTHLLSSPGLAPFFLLAFLGFPLFSTSRQHIIPSFFLAGVNYFRQAVFRSESHGQEAARVLGEPSSQGRSTFLWDLSGGSFHFHSLDKNLVVHLFHRKPLFFFVSSWAAGGPPQTKNHRICLRVQGYLPYPFFPGILLSRKKPKSLGKWRSAFEKNDG